MKKVTVMIPTYNQSAYLGKCIESALAQDYPNLEVVVSDDGSSDNTRETVEPFLADPRLRYFRNEKNLGRVGNYRQTLYHYAEGDYVINLDGDDWFVNASYIRKAAELLDSDPDIVCVLGDRAVFYEAENRFKSGQNAHIELPEVMYGNDFFIHYPELDFSFSHLSVLYRREDALALDFYRKDILSADAESIFRLMLNRKIGYLPEVAGAWRVHGANESGTKELKKIFDNLALFDALYDDALARGSFDQADLEEWYVRIRSNHLFRHIITMVRKRDAGTAMKLLLLSFKKDRRVGYRIVKKILAKIKAKVLPVRAVDTRVLITSAH